MASGPARNGELGTENSVALGVAGEVAPPDVLEAMRDHDVLLHHPYDSFSTSVQRFLEQAVAYAALSGMRDEAERMAAVLAGVNGEFAERWKLVRSEFPAH